jgi:TniQ
MSGRLLFRVDPVAGESPRGYLCRAAHEHGYSSPNALAQIAGLWVSGAGDVGGLDHDAAIPPLSYVLRLEPEEWRSICYHHIKGRTRFKRSFHNQTISADDLNYRRPRLCAACLRERSIWWAVWDLGLVTACPVHRCLLLNQCPSCKRRITWERPAVHKCRCGFDVREISPEPADSDLVAISAIVYRAAQFTQTQTVEINLGEFDFPPELLHLKLGTLLRFILFVGSINDGSVLRRKQRPFCATDLTLAMTICRGAAALLRDWPQPLREVLRRMIPQSANVATLNFSDIFGNFYRHLFRVLPRREFGFLHDAFEQVVIEDWKGFIRGQHRYFSAAVRRNSHWVTANEAERIARTTGARILDLAREGQVDAIFLKVRSGGNRRECWIQRESLNQWIAARDAELAPYMPRSEAVEMLGLKNISVSAVAAAGAIRYVKGPDRNFPTGCFFFLREDVAKIKEAFERHRVPMMAYSKPGDLIALRHAMKNFLGRSAGLAAAIGAIVDGALVPVARTMRFRGITGYVFRAEDLRRYRQVPGIAAPRDGFLNYRETAAVLGVRTDAIRGLADQGILSPCAHFRNGLARLIPAKEAKQFAERFVSTLELAKRLHLHSGSLLRHLKESEAPLLEISTPAPGKRHACFLPRDVAARLQFPTRRMLEDEARRRTEAYRRARWEEYRLAREVELGRPLRRLRAHRRRPRTRMIRKQFPNAT